MVEVVVEAVAAVVAEAPVEAEPVAEATAEAEPVVEAAEEITEAVAETPAETTVEETAADAETPQHAAYEEFLKDDGEALTSLSAAAEEETPVEPAASPEPVTKLDASGELRIQMDTKNAHVWNELGNVYYNNGAIDDSILAYSKAIELDRYFPWAYSNLALAYVTKRRFAEAILLYQRSIELFTGEKDKAMSWNRLGNVYRRLSEYDHAMEAYQRADDLDPDNTNLSLQSRFSLLGNYQLEQSASYAA